MDDSDSTLIRITCIIILVVFSAFFAACEAAFFSLNPLQISNLKANKGKKGGLVHILLESPKDLLVAIYLGNEVVNVAISAISTSIAYTLFGNFGISLAIGIGTFIILLFGEIIPKTLALKFAERFSLFAAYPLKCFSILIRPAQKFMISISDKLISKLELGTKEKQINIMSDDELKTMVDMGENHGGLEEEESRMIQNVIRFGETTVVEIMTPKIEMFTLTVDEALENILPKITNNFYSRVPVFNEAGEEIKGILFTKDLNRLKSSAENFVLKNHLREPLFVPESKNIKELLQEFKKQKRHMAIVLDEFGSVSGLVTLEDILEELVGEIDSEMRKEENPITPISQDNYCYRLSGTLTLGEFNKFFQIQLPEGRFDTIGGMIFGLFGRIPRFGESITYENLKFTIEKMKGARIETLVLILSEPIPKEEVETSKR